LVTRIIQTGGCGGRAELSIGRQDCHGSFLERMWRRWSAPGFGVVCRAPCDAGPVLKDRKWPDRARIRRGRQLVADPLVAVGSECAAGTLATSSPSSSP